MGISKAARLERAQRQRHRIYRLLFGAAVIIVAGFGVAALGELLS